MHKVGDPVAARVRNAVLLLVAGVSAAAFTSWAAAAMARPLVPAERRFDYYSGRVPVCNDPSVFERIQSRFAAREGEFWKSGLAILGFDRVREIGIAPKTYNKRIPDLFQPFSFSEKTIRWAMRHNVSPISIIAGDMEAAKGQFRAAQEELEKVQPDEEDD